MKFTILILTIFLVFGCDKLQNSNSENKVKIDYNKMVLDGAAGNDMEQLKTALKNGGNIEISNSYGNRALSLAVLNDNMEMVKFLLKKGAKVEFKNSAGTTPFLIAAGRKNWKMGKFLLENGADPNSRQNNGLAPIMLSYKPEILKILLKNGANCDIRDKKKISALQYHVVHGSVDTVKLLIEYGADLNLQDFEGNTPLMMAVLLKKYEIVKLLLEGGASPFVVNDKGKTAKIFARQWGQAKFISLIEKYENKQLWSVEKNGEIIDISENFEGDIKGKLDKKGDNIDIGDYSIVKNLYKIDKKIDKNKVFKNFYQKFLLHQLPAGAKKIETINNIAFGGGKLIKKGETKEIDSWKYDIKAINDTPKYVQIYIKGVDKDSDGLSKFQKELLYVYKKYTTEISGKNGERYLYFWDTHRSAPDRLTLFIVDKEIDVDLKNSKESFKIFREVYFTKDIKKIPIIGSEEFKKGYSLTKRDILNFIEIKKDKKIKNDAPPIP